MDKDKEKTEGWILSEVISPIFGHDTKYNIISNGKKDSSKDKTNESFNYLESHIEEQLLQEKKLAKVQEYQTKIENDCDILKKYQKTKSEQEIIESLPSNYLDFIDKIEKNPSLSVNTKDSTVANKTISEIINDIFEQEK